MTFTLTIDCDNAAFDEHFTVETARILRKAAEKLEAGTTDGGLLDYNGNRVGSFSFSTLRRPRRASGRS